MRRHAKASSAGSISDTGSSRGLFGHAFVIRGASGEAKGSGAFSARRAFPLALFSAMLFSLALVGTASAAKVHLFKETFGGGSPPTFAKPLSVAVDQSSGDVLVLDGGANEVQSLKVAAESGQFKLTFVGPTTEYWTGTGVVTCNGTSTSITSATTATGTLASGSVGEVISSSPASCIKPGTKITAVSGTTITLSQATESNANSGTLNLSAERPFNQTTGWTGAGGVTCNGTSTSVTAATTTGALSKGEQISAISGSCIKPGTTITNISGTTITLSQTTESNANSGTTNLQAELPFNVSNTNLKEALEKLSSIGTGNVAVTAGPGSKTGSTPYSIQFKGSLATRDVATITAQNGATPLAGGEPITEILVTPTNGFASGIRRFKPDGTPDNYTALGTNIIDGRRGPGGKTRAECGTAPEPASCDETPQNGFIIGTATEVQIAVDNSDGVAAGNIYLTQYPSKLVDVFAADGHFLGQLTKYKQGASADGPEHTFEPCGVSVGPAGPVYVAEFPNQVHKYIPSANPPVTTDNIANFTSSSPCIVAAGTGPTAGYIFVTRENGEISKLDNTTGASQYTVASGKNTTETVDPASGQVLAASGSIVTEYDASGATSAAEASTLTAASTVQGLAVRGATGNIYLSRTGSSTIDVFGPTVSTPSVFVNAATEISTTKATLNGAVGAESSPVSVCKFEYLSAAEYAANGNSYSGPNVPQTKSCAEAVPVDSNVHPVSAAISGLQGNATYHYRLTAENGTGAAVTADKTFSTASTVITGQAAAISDTTTIVNGTVNPLGAPFSACKFEYLSAAEYAANGNSYSGSKTPASKACTPAAASIESDFQAHAVNTNLTGLAKNTTYHFRLSATNASGTVSGADQSFTTIGEPQVVREQATLVGRTDATLTAQINPSGFATSYHLEWGANTSYGTRIPAEANLFIGSGTSPVEVSAEISGLQANTTYYFRVVATNASGTTTGPDQEFTTLGANGLPDQRGIELVSPPDKRPVGSAQGFLTLQINQQVAESGEAVGYTLLNGLEDSTSGGVVAYSSARSGAGWSSAQVSPPSLVPPAQSGQLVALPGRILYYDPANLKCALFQSNNPLSPDVPAADIANGVTNLYRWNAADGSFTLITSKIPLDPGVSSGGLAYYEVAGASSDCSRIFFRSTTYSYLEGASGVYEWDNGALRDALALPDRSIPGAGSGPRIGELPDTVSPNGRFAFTAKSDQGAVSGVTPGDAGMNAVFVRKSPTETVDASLPTNGPALGASYELMSADGSHVLFLANYGIASTSSEGPTENCSSSGTACDLYDYDLESGQLTDVSADTNPADPDGAVVRGAMAVSADGSTVYFAARGQLVPGQGRTYAQNLEGTKYANVYRWHAGTLSYVGSLTAANSGALASAPGSWTAQTNAAGSYFLFASHDDMTGTNPAEVEEAYLYSAATGATECISCPGDGSAPHAEGAGLLPHLESIPSGNTYVPSSLSEDGRVVFTVEDALTPNAVEGHGAGAERLGKLENNIYEWHNGQVALLASGQVSAIGMGGPDGRDVFIRALERLAPQDDDFSYDLYDFRSGGGFAPPAVPPSPCDPAADQCQGAPSQAPAVPGTATGASGPGNPAPAAGKGHHKKKHHKKKHHKKKHHKKKHHKKKHRSRTANSNRGGAK